MHLSDTIIAIASPPGARSPRGIIRISGPQTLPILSHCLIQFAALSSGNELPTDPANLPRGMYRARLNQLDFPVLLAIYRAPNSYTGEESAELFLPGNPYLLNKVVDHLVSQEHVRRAEPGEFTARAYLNGRMTLTQAEGVSAAIAAVSDAQLRAARLLMQGALGTQSHMWADQIARCLALVEAGIDFTDQEDVVPISQRELRTQCEKIRAEIQSTLDRSIGRRKLSEIPTVVLVGPPNAGKSTLFNALLNRTRTVVSDVSGTTRDVIAEPMRLNPHDPFSPEIMLVDIAGLDEGSTDDQFAQPLNPLMQRAAWDALMQADLLVAIEPSASVSLGSTASPSATTIERALAIAQQSVTPVIHVRSKSDLISANDDAFSTQGINISAKTGQGLDELRQHLHRALANRTVSLGAETLALEPRHDEAMNLANTHLDRLITALSPHDTAIPEVEIIAAELRAALDALGQLTGSHISPDDVLGRIFAGFCIGK